MTNKQYWKARAELRDEYQTSREEIKKLSSESYFEALSKLNSDYSKNVNEIILEKEEEQ